MVELKWLFGAAEMAVGKGWVCVASEDGEHVVVIYMALKLVQCRRGAVSCLFPSCANTQNAYCARV